MPKYRGDKKKYIAVELPVIFDIDEYMLSIGFETTDFYRYTKQDMSVIFTADGFFCTKVEYRHELSIYIETICCQLNFIPDIWQINMILTQIGFK